ncbi:MAG: hypothetical protein WC895_05500 [Candidatus Shapirobacteria bacterium]|jgi:hypothetical protein
MQFRIIKKEGRVIGFELIAPLMYDEEAKDFVRLLPSALERGEGKIEIVKNKITIKIKEDWWQSFEINEEDAAIIKQHIESKKMLWTRGGGLPVSVELTFKKRFAGCVPRKLKTTN